MEKKGLNRKLRIAIIIIILVLIEISILSYIAWKDKRKAINNEQIENDYILDRFDEISKYEIQQQEEEFKKEINDKNTIHYTMIEASNDSIILEYAYVTEEYTKIKLSYKLNNNFNSISKQKEAELIRKYNKTIKQLKEEEGDTYIETSDGKRYIPQRTNDGDGGRTVSTATGIYEWHDTFPLTSKDTTENLILYFTKANNEIVKLELSKQI